jgi:hypothetical protein
MPDQAQEQNQRFARGAPILPPGSSCSHAAVFADAAGACSLGPPPRLRRKGGPAFLSHPPGHSRESGNLRWRDKKDAWWWAGHCPACVALPTAHPASRGARFRGVTRWVRSNRHLCAADCAAPPSFYPQFQNTYPRWFGRAHTPPTGSQPSALETNGWRGRIGGVEVVPHQDRSSGRFGVCLPRGSNVAGAVVATRKRGRRQGNQAVSQAADSARQVERSLHRSQNPGAWRGSVLIYTRSTRSGDGASPCRSPIGRHFPKPGHRRLPLAHLHPLPLEA